MSDKESMVQSVVKVLTDVVSSVPTTTEPKAADPSKRASELTFVAKMKAAAVSGTLSLPPGPAGMLTILPDLIAIWRIQQQLVVDIAAAYGKDAELTREQMLYCLFRHAASQAVRDLVVRVGERVLIRRATLKMMQEILEKVGIKVTQRVLGRTVSRWVPVLGAVGVAAYAWYDTNQVGKTTTDLFAKMENSDDA